MDLQQPLARGFAAALAALVGMAGAARADSLILYGGMGYLQQSHQPVLSSLLFEGDDSFADEAERAVREVVSQEGGLGALSAYPVAFYAADAEAAIAASLGAERAPRGALEDIESYFDETYGLYLIGSYEDHFTLPLEAPGTPSGVTYRTQYHASVSALLIHLRSNEIVVAASGFGTFDAGANLTEPDAARRLQGFETAYQTASRKALERLGRMAAGGLPDRAERRRNVHMVTGAYVRSQPAREVFGWQAPEAPADLCSLDSGCAEGDTACQRLEGLLIHGLTDVLSEGGAATLPPLTLSSWRSQNALGLQARFRLAQDRRSLIGQIRRFRLDPADAEYKHVALLDGVLAETESVSERIAVDQFASQVSSQRARTEDEGCVPADGVTLFSDESYAALLKLPRPATSSAPPAEAKVSYLLAATFQALHNLEDAAK